MRNCYFKFQTSFSLSNLFLEWIWNQVKICQMWLLRSLLIRRKLSNKIPRLQNTGLLALKLFSYFYSIFWNLRKDGFVSPTISSCMFCIQRPIFHCSIVNNSISIYNNSLGTSKFWYCRSDIVSLWCKFLNCSIYRFLIVLGCLILSGLANIEDADKTRTGETENIWMIVLFYNVCIL